MSTVFLIIMCIKTLMKVIGITKNHEGLFFWMNEFLCRINLLEKTNEYKPDMIYADPAALQHALKNFMSDTATSAPPGDSNG